MQDVPEEEDEGIRDDLELMANIAFTARYSLPLISFSRVSHTSTAARRTRNDPIGLRPILEVVTSQNCR